MEMKCEPYLISFGAVGIKGLRKKIMLRFHNKTFGASVPFENNVKAVFGSNGSGKTSIMLSAMILKGLLSDPDYLAAHKRQLDDLVSFESDSFNIECDLGFFSGYPRKLERLFNYSITIKRKRGIYEIEEEVLNEIYGNTVSGQRSIVFSTREGRFADICKKANPDYRQTLEGKYNNILSRSSLLSLHPKLESERNEREVFLDPSFRFSSGILALFYFNQNFSVYVANEDIPMEPYGMDYKGLTKWMNRENEAMASISDNRNKEYMFIPKRNLNDFIRNTKSLYEFVKLFKSDLVSIDVEQKEAGDGVVAVERIFNYGSYRVHSYLESTGIKNICNIFPFLSRSMESGISFIDEMDANISGIHLNRLLSYIKEYGSGQLCFTSHNTSLMDVLQDGKFGIDFISQGDFVYSWKADGNRDAESRWLKGYVPGFPFNVENVDFMKAFPPEPFIYDERTSTTSKKHGAN